VPMVPELVMVAELVKVVPVMVAELVKVPEFAIWPMDLITALLIKTPELSNPEDLKTAPELLSKVPELSKKPVTNVLPELLSNVPKLKIGLPPKDTKVVDGAKVVEGRMGTKCCIKFYLGLL